MEINNLYDVDVVKKVIMSNDFFHNYVLNKWNIDKVSVDHVDYNFILAAKSYNRWMLFRVSDFRKYKKVVIWLNVLETPKSANFDLQTYFTLTLKVPSLEYKFRFTSNTKNEFAKGIQNVLNYIINNLDDNGKLILEGKYWIDFPFNWHEYK